MTASLPGWLDTDVRKVARLDAEIAGTARSDVIGRIAVTVSDISTLGALIRTPAKLTVGSFLALQLGDMNPFCGWIAWARKDTAGFDFAKPLSEQVVASLTGSADAAA